jgi:hypothetical protein
LSTAKLVKTPVFLVVLNVIYCVIHNKRFRLGLRLIRTS